MSNSRKLRRSVQRAQGGPTPLDQRSKWWDEARARVGRENLYSCDDCGGWIVTVDRDPGVTPMFLACRAENGTVEDCKGRMHSWGYPDPAKKPEHIGPPTWEWFRPADPSKLDAAMRDHVERGGLELRRIA